MKRTLQLAAVAAIALTSVGLSRLDRSALQVRGARNITIGVVGLSPRQAAYFTVNLEPGHYGLVCFLPDRKDGKPHFMYGMTRDITVE